MGKQLQAIKKGGDTFLLIGRNKTKKSAKYTIFGDAKKWGKEEAQDQTNTQ